MMTRNWIIAWAACLPIAGALGAQEDRKPAYTPTAQHQLLKQFDGEWEFKSKCVMPGQEVQEGQGIESARQAFGGFWLECEDRGMMMGKEFNGQGLIGFDPQKKKFIGVWIDNYTPFLGRFEGEADSSGKVFTFRMIHEDPGAGKGGPERMVFEIKDPDHRSAKFYGKDDSGRDQLWSEIAYTRKPVMVK